MLMKVLSTSRADLQIGQHILHLSLSHDLLTYNLASEFFALFLLQAFFYPRGLQAHHGILFIRVWGRLELPEIV